MTKRFAAVIAALVMSLTAAVFTVASPASAACTGVGSSGECVDTFPGDGSPDPTFAPDTPNSCSQAYAYCGYDQINYGTGRVWERHYVFSAGCYGVAYNDKWDSFFNNSGRTVTIYRDGGCTGTNITAYTNTGWRWLGSVAGAALLNSVSSVRVH